MPEPNKSDERAGCRTCWLLVTIGYSWLAAWAIGVLSQTFGLQSFTSVILVIAMNVLLFFDFLRPKLIECDKIGKSK